LTQGQFEACGFANGQEQRIFGRKPEHARPQASTKKNSRAEARDNAESWLIKSERRVAKPAQNGFAWLVRRGARRVPSLPVQVFRDSVRPLTKDGILGRDLRTMCLLAPTRNVWGHGWEQCGVENDWEACRSATRTR
jgi:hypothetical protein